MSKKLIIKEIKRKEVPMSFRSKIAIFLVATLVTIIGFNAIASPSVEIMKIGKKAGYEIIANVLAREAAARPIPM
jgi:hypothetical protein